MDTMQIYNKNPLIVLSYISKFRGKNTEVTATRISKKLGISIGSVYSILKEFEEAGLVQGLRIGRTTIYEPVHNNPLMKNFKVFDNLLFLNELVQQLKKYTRKIILFGSCSRGEDDTESDIDILVLSDEELHSSVREVIASYQSEREIKPVIVDSLELLDMQRNDRIFYEEIQKGILLWGEE